jgi:hypothetical protein
MADLSSFQAIIKAEFNLGTLTGTFQPLNTTGFSDDIKILKIFNGSMVGVEISYDGINPHDFWPSGATIIIDFQANHSDNSAYGAGTLNGRKNQVIWGRTATNPTYLQMVGYR